MLDKLGLHTVQIFQKAREAVISRQQEELLELSTPVVKLWDGILALPMIGTLDSARTQVVMESLLQRIVDTGSEIAIIDITGVPTVDTVTAQHLLKTVTAIRMMGADCIISGIRPQIAQTIVHLGIDLQGVTTKATLADALALGPQAIGFRGFQAKGLTEPRLWNEFRFCVWADSCLLRSRSKWTTKLPSDLQEDLTSQIEKTGAQGVLIDISAVETVDSFIGRMIGNISAMSLILDARTVVVGMQPAVAITLVELGLTLPGVRTALNVERGMALLAALANSRKRGTSVAKSESLPVRLRTGHRRGAAGDSQSRSADWVQHCRSDQNRNRGQ